MIRTRNSNASVTQSARRRVERRRRFEAQEDTRMVGEVVETLIRIKDTFYGDLTLAQRDALDDACNLLANNIGERTRYDYTCRVDDGARRF